MTLFKHACGMYRANGVTAGWAVANLVYFADGLHGITDSNSHAKLEKVIVI